MIKKEKWAKDNWCGEGNSFLIQISRSQWKATVHLKFISLREVHSQHSLVYLTFASPSSRTLEFSLCSLTQTYLWKKLTNLNVSLCFHVRKTWREDEESKKNQHKRSILMSLPWNVTGLTSELVILCSKTLKELIIKEEMHFFLSVVYWGKCFCVTKLRRV